MIRIYVANLGNYNRGELRGCWINLPKDKEVLQKIVNDEEITIHDYETDIRELKIKEYDDIFELNELAEKLEELEDYEKDLLEAIIECHTSHLEEALDILEKGDYSYFTGIHSKEDLGYQCVKEGLFGEIPDNLINYIDYEKLGRDLTIDGYCIASNGIAIYIP